MDSDKRQRVECSKEVGTAGIRAPKLDHQLCIAPSRH